MSLGPSPGSVVVVAPTAAAPAEAWRAVTDRRRVSQWLGTLSGDLAPGAHVRLDFGDGDFFDMEVEHVGWPSVRWDWRFMGTGPRDAVELLVDGRDGASVVTVTDREPRRDADEALSLGEGWRDFTARLQRHLATGKRTRYDWRSDVDVWIELPIDAGAARGVAIGQAAFWLPLEAGAANLMEADSLVLDDGDEPSAFAISRITGTGVASVKFELQPEDIDGTLATSIAVAPRGDGSTLAVSQTGFRELPTDDAVQRRLRERFAAAWLAAVRRAAHLASSG